MQYQGYEQGRTVTPKPKNLIQLAKGLETKPIELLAKESREYYYRTPYGKEALKTSWINKYYHQDEGEKPPSKKPTNGLNPLVTTVEPLPEFRSVNIDTDEASKLRQELDRMKGLYKKSQDEVVRLQYATEDLGKLRSQIALLRYKNEEQQEKYEVTLAKAKAEAAHFKDRYEKINQPKHSDLDVLEIFRAWSRIKND